MPQIRVPGPNGQAAMTLMTQLTGLSRRSKPLKAPVSASFDRGSSRDATELTISRLRLGFR
jgi:hypothetical protein